MKTSPIKLHKNISRALADKTLAEAMARARVNFIGKRARAVRDYNSGGGRADADGGDFEALRDYGKQVRDYAITHMPALLRQFCDNAEAAGATVLWAESAADAQRLVVDIASRHDVRMAVKSKSMASEEVRLNDALIDSGVQTVETDLGEFIIQLDGDVPSHIVGPAVHKTRAEVSALFERHLAVKTSDIKTLTLAARAHLREKFFAAEMGISGANFLVADSGAAVIVTNEGNGRMVTTLPRVHVTLAGIDKIIAQEESLPYLLTLLTRSATGQRLSNYVSMTCGRRRDDADDKGGGGESGGGYDYGAEDGSEGGPRHVYVVLLDNGRSALRGGVYRDMLRCIRCGACMNHCPVYHSIGGHAYGSVYMGPMGQVLTPAMNGLGGMESAGELPFAATLCGACEVVCPVKIPLPTLLRRLRAERVRRRLSPLLDRAFIRLWSFCAMRPPLYAALTAFAARLGHFAGGRKQFLRRAPGLGAWLKTRDLPTPRGGRTFRDLWRESDGEV